MVDQEKVKMGKASRKAGKAFEIEVRNDLESKGWIVVRWDKNIKLEIQTKSPDVDFEEEGNKKIIKITEYQRTVGKLITAKHTFNPYTKAMSAGNGFPDFVCIKFIPDVQRLNHDFLFDVKLVECKMSGKLDRLEKDKIEWIKQNLHIPVLLAIRDYPEENIELPVKKRKKKTIVYEEL
jgi:hypothetical protein